MLRRRVQGYASVRIATLTIAVAIVGCGSDAPKQDQKTGSATGSTAAAPGVTGPLCDALPAGDDPGAPASLTGDSADVALQWIPVVTTFEAAVRASGLARELHGTRGVTILAPTDDAFTAAFDRQRLDDLLLSRRRELRGLLEGHMVDGVMSLSDLRDADSVTTLSGDTVKVTRAGGMARFGDRATTVCADYRAANAAIHVIDGVLP
jgi:hypothetical protein